MVLGVWVRRWAAVGVLVGMAACGGGSGEGKASASFGPDELAESDRIDADVIRRYVEAMADGDVDAALELRCRKSHPAPGLREQFEDELGRFVDAAGEMTLSRIEVTDHSPAVREEYEDRSPVELTYWLAFDGVESDEPSIALVTDADADAESEVRQFCLYTTDRYASMARRHGDDLRDLGPLAAPSLAELMPTPPPEYRMRIDQPMDPSTSVPPLDEGTEAWEWQWLKADYGGFLAEAVRFASPDKAMDAAREHSARALNTTIELYEVPELEGAMGARWLASEWLWLQPPNEGPYIDEVTMVFGDTYVWVSVAALPTGSDHSLVVDVARQMAELAQP